MNKDILDKKLKMYISSMAINNMPFGREWDSSAKNLEDELLMRGIKLPQKLYYEYKMPGQVKQNEFMDNLIMEYFVAYFYSWFAKDVLKDKNLKMSEKAKIFTYVWKNRAKYTDILKQYEIGIRNLNLELKNIKVDDSRSLVYGAMFGFAPQEIAYFSDGAHRDLEKETENFKIFKNYGLDVTYILAPETAEMVISALKQKALNKSKER